jgi:hypothetical protein
VVEYLVKLAPYLWNPLVLVGFVVLIVCRALLELGDTRLLGRLSKAQSGKVALRGVQYVFWLAVITIVLSFGYAVFKQHNDAERGGVHIGPRQSGPAKTSGDNSPANTGDSNTFTYGDTKTPPSKKPTQKELQP